MGRRDAKCAALFLLGAGARRARAARATRGVCALLWLAALGCNETRVPPTGSTSLGERAAAVGGAGAAATGSAGMAAAISRPVAGAVAVPSGVPASGAGASMAGSGAAAAGGLAGAGAGTAGSAGSGAGPSAGAMVAAGSGGSVGAAGSGGTSLTSKPSAGCARQAGRPADGLVQKSDRIYSFPAGYDGKTPMPMLLALHAAGNPNTQLQNLTKGSRLESELVRIFPKSTGSAWVYDTDSPKLMAVLDDVLSNYCIDESRLFATGHSSGAQMVVQLLCKGEKRFRAVAPVAASKYCAKLPPTAVLYIQGMQDAQRGGGNGMDVVSVFSAGNGCGTGTRPRADIAGCNSTFDRMPVTPGCVEYQGCTAPTVWCSHNDNGYNNTDGRQHGWPCFASGAIADFFLGER